MRMTERRSERLRERYEFTKHPSGLGVYVFPKALTATYAILSTRYGSVDCKFRREGERDWIEIPDGVAHFLEHKLFENADGSDSFERFSALGADANAYTSCNRTAYLFSCTEHFSESLEELLTFVTSPYFTEETVAKERGIIAEEIRMYDDSPWERCFQNLMEGMYHSHPVRRPICGSERSIARITPDMLYDCYRLFYQPSNAVLVVCGNVASEEVMKVVDRILPSERQEIPVEKYRFEEPREVRQSLVTARMQVAKPVFTIGIKDVDVPSDPDARARRDAAMCLLEEILFSRSGKFYSELFEEGLITPSYSFGYSISEDFGFHNLSGESDSPEEVGRRLWQYLDHVRENGIDPEEFERCRRVLYADELRSFDSTEEIANNLLSSLFDDCELFGYPELLESICIEELTPLLEGMLDPHLFCLSAVYPQDDNSQETRS